MARVLLLAVAVFATAFAEAAPLPPLCSFTEGQFASYNAVQQCFYSIPLSDEIKEQTVQTMLLSSEMYAFLDIARDSPTPELPVHVDLHKELMEIRERLVV